MSDSGESRIPYLELRLTETELLLALRFMGAPMLPDLANLLPAGLTEHEQELVLASAEKSLRARGLVADESSSPNGMALSEIGAALLGTCFKARAFATVTSESQAGEIDHRVFYFGEDLAVEAGPAEAGIYYFLGSADRRLALARVVDQIGLDGASDQEVNADPFQVRQDAIQKAVELAREAKDLDRATMVLSNGGAPSRSAQLLAAALAGACKVTTVSFGSVTGEGAETGSIILLETDEGFWMLEPDSSDAPLVVCRLASSADVRQRVSPIFLGEG